MNVEALEALMETVEKAKMLEMKNRFGLVPRSVFYWDDVPDVFDMRYGYSVDPHCGSMGCLIGFGLGMSYNGKGSVKTSSEEGAFQLFGERFGLSIDMTTALCHPRGNDESLSDILYSDVTPQDAVKAIQHVIDGARTAKKIWKHMLD